MKTVVFIKSNVITVNNTTSVEQAEHFKTDTKTIIKAITYQSHSNCADHLIDENNLYSKFGNHVENLSICKNAHS